MNEIAFLFLIAALILLGLCLLILRRFFAIHRRYDGRQVTICPHTGQIVELELKATRAGFMSLIGKREVQVKWCSLWPKMKGCTEECTRRVAMADYADGATRGDSRSP